MTTPVTTLDQRFSDPAAAATSWDVTREALESAGLFWISTVRADGRPHVSPLVAVWADGALHFCTGETEQKAINLAANPHVVLTTGCNGWDGGLDVMVEGDAVRVTDDDDPRRLAGAWTAKWDGRWHYQVRGRLLPPRRQRRAGPGVRGRPGQGPRLHQGHVQPHAPPLLRARPLLSPASGAQLRTRPGAADSGHNLPLGRSVLSRMLVVRRIRREGQRWAVTVARSPERRAWR